MLSTLAELFVRDLASLKKELEQYPSEAALWKRAEGINNTGGNLALHLAGNLRHFIGATLGNNGYVRDRHGEFNDVDVPRSEICARIDAAAEDIRVVFGALSEEELDGNYAIEVFGEPVSTRRFMLHLYGHLNYHLGQISYHRRLLSS